MATRLTSQPLLQKAWGEHTHNIWTHTHIHIHIVSPLSSVSHISFSSVFFSSSSHSSSTPAFPPFSHDFTFHSSFHFLTLFLLPSLVFLFSSFPTFLSPSHSFPSLSSSSPRHPGAHANSLIWSFLPWPGDRSGPPPWRPFHCSYSCTEERGGISGYTRPFTKSYQTDTLEIC